MYEIKKVVSFICDLFQVQPTKSVPWLWDIWSRKDSLRKQHHLEMQQYILPPLNLLENVY